MTYKWTILNKVVLYGALSSILFFIMLYSAAGSGPWDLFVYLAVAALFISLLVLDFLYQVFQNNGEE